MHNPPYRFCSLTKENILAVSRFRDVSYRRARYWLYLGILLLLSVFIAAFPSYFGVDFSTFFQQGFTWVASLNFCFAVGILFLVRGFLILLMPRTYYLTFIALYYNSVLAKTNFFCVLIVFCIYTWALNQPHINIHLLGGILYFWIIMRLVFFFAGFVGGLERASPFDYTVYPQAGFKECFPEYKFSRNNNGYNRGLESALGASPGTFEQGH